MADSLYRRLRKAIGVRLRRKKVDLVPGYTVSLEQLIRYKQKLLGPNTPLHVYGVWRQRLAALLSAESFQEAALPNVWDIYPGKFDRQLVVAQCLNNLAAQGVPGVIAEFGCFQGHTAVQMLQTLKRLGDPARVLLFDSFEGVPASDHPDDAYWKQGTLAADFGEVQRRFAGEPRVELVRGFFKDTLPRFASLRVKFAHVDADLYVSIKDVNAWLLDRVEPGGMIVYDDYGFPVCEGARRVVDEDLGARADYTRFYLPTGQYLAIRNRA